MLRGHWNILFGGLVEECCESVGVEVVIQSWVGRRLSGPDRRVTRRAEKHTANKALGSSF
jgi:hypothetical protein